MTESIPLSLTTQNDAVPECASPTYPDEDALRIERQWKRACVTIHNMLLRDRKAYHHLCIHPQRQNILFGYLNEKDPPVLLIYFCVEPKLHIEALKDIIVALDAFQTRKCFIVYQQMLTSSVKKTLEHLRHFDIELWSIRELQYTVTDHVLYVPHEKVPPSDFSKIFVHPQNADSIMKTFPKLLRTDMVTRYFGFQRNDLIRIRRKDGTLCYRVVK